MKKLLLTSAVLFSLIIHAHSQLAVWNFNSSTLVASSTDANVTASNASHSGLAGTTQFFNCNGKSWSPSGWSSGDYAEYTVTANAGFTMSVTGFTLVTRKSSSGPSPITIRSSNDGYMADLFSETVNSSCTAKGGSISTINIPDGGSITFRIFGVGSSSGGNLRMDDVTILGTTAPVSMPVEMTSFNARNVDNNVHLAWATASELNNSHFELEVSQDGRQFENITQIQGNGTTLNAQSYEYIHQNPANGVSYYRLKQVDFDGAFEYSEVRSVRVEGENNIRITPSAAISQIEVEVNTLIANNTSIRIIDMMGRTVLSTTFDGDSNSKVIDVVDLSKGHYIVHVQAGAEVMTQRFVKITE